MTKPPSPDDAFSRLMAGSDMRMDGGITTLLMNGHTVFADSDAGTAFRSELHDVFANEICKPAGIDPDGAELGPDAALYASRLLSRYITSKSSLRAKTLLAVTGVGLLAVTEEIGVTPTQVMPLEQGVQLFGRLMLVGYDIYPKIELPEHILPDPGGNFSGEFPQGLIVILEDVIACDSDEDGEFIESFERVTVPLPFEQLKLHEVIRVA